MARSHGGGKMMEGRGWRSQPCPSGNGVSALDHEGGGRKRGRWPPKECLEVLKKQMSTRGLCEEDDRRNGKGGRWEAEGRWLKPVCPAISDRPVRPPPLHFFRMCLHHSFNHHIWLVRSFSWLGRQKKRNRNPSLFKLGINLLQPNTELKTQSTPQAGLLS